MKINKYTENGIVVIERIVDDVIVGKEEYPVLSNDTITEGLPIDERLTNIEYTLDLILLKQEGII